MKPHVWLGTAVLLLAALTGRAQSTPPAPPAESHQFDFWIGEWNVSTPDGKPAGTSRVEPIAGGHGLLENWQGIGGPGGKSLNAFDATTKQWRQFWIGVGGILELTGGLDAEGHMVLSGRTAGPKGETLERITWTPSPDGSVRQAWEQSKDAGATWQTAFVGVYRRK